jgi:2-oxoglutarate ferredoxin oxidoreductase subunit beta
MDFAQKKLLFDKFSGYTPTWCPGCGDWGIVRAIKKSLAEQGFSPSDVLIAFDIGCSGNMNDFLNSYSTHTLHGRSIATAVGMKLAQPNRQVMVIGGDGALYGEGGNHFLHACRGNHDLTVIVHDNKVYGLTKGQVSPSAYQGYRSTSTPGGIIEVAANPLALAITQGATFVAQSFAGKSDHVCEMITKAMQHKGFALVNILQPCVTFNKVNTYHYFMERTYHLDKEYDSTNQASAITKSLESQKEKFPLGVLFQDFTKKPYHELLNDGKPQNELVLRDRFTDFGTLIDKYV